MKNMHYRNIVLAIASLFTFSIADAQQNRQAEIDTLMHKAHRLGMFNGNVLVKDKGKTVYHAAIGVTDASGKTSLTEQYRFHIGSIAKEFSAAGIALLAQEGKLSLEDNISKYLTDLPSWADSVKIIHVLQYTSGLPDVRWKIVKSDAEADADLRKLEKLNATPGTTYNYNNNNILVQRRIIAKVSGMSFQQFVTERLLKPAGMKTAIVDPTESTPRMTKSFDNDHRQDPLVYPIAGLTAVTLEDLYKWSESLNNFTILTPASVRSIVTPAGPNKQAGLGAGSMEGDKLITHRHDGTGYNYQALLISDMSKGRTVVLLTNNRQDNLYNIENAIEAVLDGKPYKQIRKSAVPYLQARADTMSKEQIIDLYNQQKKTTSKEYDYDEEYVLNALGYYLMAKRRIDDAIALFTYNVALFPQSGNAFDSLGEAYYNKGDKVNALINYKRSLALDPSNQAAKMVIAELEPAASQQ